MNAICLVIDRLHAGYLGCYGNSWIVTPEFNRLAAESFVFDQAFVDAAGLADLYRAWWTGRHRLESSDGTVSAAVALPAQLAAKGVPLTLFTDDPWAGLPGWEGGVAERIEIPGEQAMTTARELGETHCAKFFATAMDWLSSAREPFCLWMHTQGMGAPWDAPLEYRNQYADDNEGAPPPLVEPPHLLLPENYDPDTLLGYTQSYAGQLSLLDECLGGFLAFLRESPLHNDTLLMVVSARGFALGEHRRVGAWDATLHEELIHVPWLIRHPDGIGAAARTQTLVQPPDLMPTLREWFEIPAGESEGRQFARSLWPLVRGDGEFDRDRIVVAGDEGNRGIRTPAWYLRMCGESTAGADPGVGRLLYAKPDDRWEMNELAARCGDVVESLEQAAREFETLAPAGQLGEVTPLGQTLTSTVR